MKRLFILTPEAKRDIREILLDIAEDSPENAERIRSEIYNALQKLGRSPDIGHFHEELLSRKCRFWNFYKYVIAYAREPKPIQIIGVVHGTRDLAVFHPRKSSWTAPRPAPDDNRGVAASPVNICWCSAFARKTPRLSSGAGVSRPPHPKCASNWSVTNLRSKRGTSGPCWFCAELVAAVVGQRRPIFDAIFRIRLFVRHYLLIDANSPLPQLAVDESRRF